MHFHKVALGRVTDMLRSPTTSRVHLNKLLGSLRHVVTCIQPAAPFFQQLAALQRMTTRHSQVVVHEDARGDLLWFRAILQAQYLNRLPLARFARSQSLTIEIWMDASDLGLCAVFPARKEYLQVKFDDDERRQISACKDGLKSDFGINVRELMSTVFAAIVWGSLWKSPCSFPEAHVRMWIDNTSAAAWNNKRFTRNPFAQLLLRLLALLEVKHQFYVTASHIPGAGNVMADGGSRAWESPTMRREGNRGINGSARVICSVLMAIRDEPSESRQYVQYDMLQALCGTMAPPVCARAFTNPVLKQQPLTPSLLRRVHASCDLYQPSQQLLWGGLLLAYFFMFRRSEYLYIGKRCQPYILKLGDIKLCDAAGCSTKAKKAVIVGIVLHGAKNNQFGREEVRYQHQSLDPILCPVRAARWIHKGARAIGTNVSEPAMQLRTGGGVSSSQVAKIIKTAAAEEGLDPTRFSTHSVRVGGATKLLNAGADRLAIKVLGRWMSSCFEDCPVLTMDGTKGLSQMMSS
ncbi:hypothetical protein FI667_g16910, partial [Globisporangium splendens]